ncbi:hypothetical protein [Promicromonospora umidemergens]|uniref:hypothetical protein n=1 Tax=Promicromonospora umidemergens TaxID=629679 RepID=UPI003FD8649F
MTFHDSRHAEWALWQLGTDAETLAPQVLRAALRDRAAALAARSATQPSTADLVATVIADCRLGCGCGSPSRNQVCSRRPRRRQTLQSAADGGPGASRRRRSTARSRRTTGRSSAGRSSAGRCVAGAPDGRCLR